MISFPALDFAEVFDVAQVHFAASVSQSRGAYLDDDSSTICNFIFIHEKSPSFYLKSH